MRAERKLFLVVLTLCGYWLGLPTARALPVETLAQSLVLGAPLAVEAKAKKPPRKAAAARRGKKKATAKTPLSPAPAVAAEAAVPIPTPPPPPPNLKLKAALAASGPDVTEGLGWRVLAEKPAAGKAERIVWSGGGAEPSIHLDPGRYYVEASFGFARNGQDIEIPPDSALNARVVLNAGTILAQGVAVAGGPPLERMFYVLRRSPAAGAPADEIGRSSLSAATFHVPAGAYSLAMQHGLARTEIPVVVAAGQEAKAEGVLNSGHLKLGATAKSGGPLLDDAVFFVYTDGTDAVPQEIARSELRLAEFDLPAGQYKISALWGLARTDRQITIKAGASAEETLVLDAGEVSMSSVLTGNDRPLDRQIVYKIYALSGDQGPSPQSIATMAKPSPVLHLKSGKYRIESQYGWHNARQTREVDVIAGEKADLVFEHKASEVKLKLAIAPGTPAPGRVKWTVKYANGGTVLISQDDAPSLILQAGSYQAVAQYGNKTYSRSFEANPNEVHVIELFAE